MIGLSIYLAIGFIAGLILLSFIKPPTKTDYEEFINRERKRGSFKR